VYEDESISTSIKTEHDDVFVECISDNEPDAANAEYICALHNAAPGLIARAELLEEIMRAFKSRHPYLTSKYESDVLQRYAALEKEQSNGK
jgi:hypothetical protein